MSLGRVIDSSQKCHTKHTLPTSYRGSSTARRNAKRSSPPAKFFGPEETHRNATVPAPKGKDSTSRRMLCQPHVNPSRTIYRGSECERSNAKDVAPPPFYLELERKCSNAKDVPLQGKGQDMFAEMPCNKRLSQPVKGVIVKTQKCQDIVSPRGPRRNRRNAKVSSPPPNLGHRLAAEMPPGHRPITRGQPATAEMPVTTRLAT